MPLELKHFIAKKIDASGLIAHWFEIRDRSKGTQIITFEFERMDGTVFNTAFELTRIKAAERVAARRSKRKVYGDIPIFVPDGRYIKRITIQGFTPLGLKTEKADLAVSPEFNDVYKMELEASAMIARIEAGFNNSDK